MLRSRTFKSLGALALGLTCAGAAQALPIITDWSYSIASIWSDFGPAGVTRSADNQTLTWGAAGQSPSSLIITDPAMGTLETLIGVGTPTAANIGTGLSVTHVNNVVSMNVPSLESAQLTSQLSLWATQPIAGGPGALAPVTFDIQFTETPNTAGHCASVSTIPCNDIFVLTSGLLNASFDYLDTSYFVNIFPLVDGALSILTPAECAAAGAAVGCIGLTTVEGEISTVPFGITVSTRPLPEPGVLALLGIGLLGLGAARRSSASRKAG